MLRCIEATTILIMQPVREAVSYRGLFTADWFGVREKHYSQLKIYDRLRASEQPDVPLQQLPRPRPAPRHTVAGT